MVTRERLVSERERLQAKLATATTALQRNAQERATLTADGHGLSGAILILEQLLKEWDESDADHGTHNL